MVGIRKHLGYYGNSAVHVNGSSRLPLKCIFTRVFPCGAAKMKLFQFYMTKKCVDIEKHVKDESDEYDCFFISVGPELCPLYSTVFVGPQQLSETHFAIFLL